MYLAPNATVSDRRSGTFAKKHHGPDQARAEGGGRKGLEHVPLS